MENVDPALDLDAYFRRIGHAGSRAATLETLRALHALHPQAIAFENLNPMLGWPVLLDQASLQRKLVDQGRGGYCYEHNLLFGAVLRALGFKVTDLCGRVLWNAPSGHVNARTHMLLRVDLDGEIWLADVGFGALTLTAPLKLQVDIAQTTPHEAFRIVQEAGAYRMEASIQDQWKPLYSFDLQPQLQADYEMANWYLSHHPASRFVTDLMAARVAQDFRYGLRGRQFSEHARDGRVHRRVLANAAELRQLLQQTFLVRLGAEPELQALLDSVVAQPALAP